MAGPALASCARSLGIGWSALEMLGEVSKVGEAVTEELAVRLRGGRATGVLGRERGVVKWERS